MSVEVLEREAAQACHSGCCCGDDAAGAMSKAGAASATGEADATGTAGEAGATGATATTGRQQSAAPVVAVPRKRQELPPDDSPACCKSCEAVHATPARTVAKAPAGAADDAGTQSGAAGGGGTSRLEAVLLVACGVFAIAGTALHIAGLEGMFPAAVSIVAAVIGLIIIAPEVIESVRERRLDINILMVIAVVGAAILGDFSEAGVVVFFFCIGEWLEGFAIQRNRKSIEKLMDLSPETVQVLRGGEPVEASPDDVRVGETIVVAPGARIALDGVVTGGQASVDESPITGEPIPVQKAAGSQVFSGSLSVDGRLEVRVSAEVQDSTLARIVRLVEESQAQRSPVERFINRFARYYTPLVVVIAALVALLPPLAGLAGLAQLGGFDVWVYRGLSILVIGCPCSLVISTPVAVVCGLARAAQAGVLVKGGAFLELGSKVGAVAFDKTGTLTHGKPVVTKVVGYGVDEGEAIRVAYALERDSTHPLAQAVKAAFAGLSEAQAATALPAAAYAAAKPPSATCADDACGCGQPQQVAAASGIREIAGKGIMGELDGKLALVGSLAFVSSELASLEEQKLLVKSNDSISVDANSTCSCSCGCGSEAQPPADFMPPGLSGDVDAVLAEVGTALVVAYAGRVIGLVAVRDTVREETAAVVGKLSSLRGMAATVMLSGDSQTAAQAVARQAGISEAQGGLLPQDKMSRIAALRERFGVVAMVGDGINDAPALAQADIGIAMGAAGSDTALEVADVALMSNSLSALPQFFTLARKVLFTIRANVVFSLTFKAAVTVLAIAGIAGMWMAIVADVGVLLVVVLHAMTLLRRKLE